MACEDSFYYVESKVRKAITIEENGTKYSVYTIKKTSIDRYNAWYDTHSLNGVFIYIVDPLKQRILTEYLPLLLRGKTILGKKFPCSYSGFTDPETGEVIEHIAFAVEQFSESFSLPQEWCDYINDNSEQTPLPKSRIPYIGNKIKANLISLDITKTGDEIRTPNKTALRVYSCGLNRFVTLQSLTKAVGYSAHSGAIFSHRRSEFDSAVLESKIPIYKDNRPLKRSPRFIDINDVPTVLKFFIETPYGKSGVKTKKAHRRELAKELLIRWEQLKPRKAKTPSKVQATPNQDAPQATPPPVPAKADESWFTPLPAQKIKSKYTRPPAMKWFDIDKIEFMRQFCNEQGYDKKSSLIQAVTLEARRENQPYAYLVEFIEKYF